jgi:pyruvate-formate lyase-activating enzyme
MPGFTDREDEFDELVRFIQSTGIDMIQWRNLNYDPSGTLKD